MRPIVQDVAVAFWRLLPANPIFMRVVQGGSKRRRHLWVRIGYLLTLLVVMLVLQASQGMTGGSLAELAKGSTHVFEQISILQLALMCFLAPIFTSGAITQERDSETFNVLLTTPLTNAQIVLGTLMSRLFFVLMLLLSGLPIFCITMLFGGVTSQQIFESFGISACTAVLTGSLAISISVIRIGSRTTIFGFFMGIALYLLAGFVLGMWSKTYVPESVSLIDNSGMSWLAPFHPFLAMSVALNYIKPPEFGAVAHYAWPINSILAAPHIAYMFFTLFVSVVMVGFCTFFVRSGVKQGEVGWWSKLLRRKNTNGNNNERTKRARRVWSNPVAWREAITRGSVASNNLIRYTYMIGGGLAAVALVVLLSNGSLTIAEGRGWLSSIVVIEFVMVLLMASNAAATAITGERESGTMELLLTTPLTSRYIVWGKLRGLVSFAVPLLAVPAITTLFVALVGTFSSVPSVVPILCPFLLAPLMVVYASAACILGLHMSLKNKGSIQALLATVGILIVIGLGLGMCGMGVASGTGPLGPIIAPLTFVTGILFVLNPADLAANMGRSSGLTPNEALGHLVIGTILAVALYSAIVAGTYKSMITNFDMIVRKQQR